MEDKINQDLKQAMLAKDANKVSVLRSLKSAFIYAKVAPGAPEGPLSEGTLLTLVAKESKKRQESADSYAQAGQPERAEAEMAEKAIIDSYLPVPLTVDELRVLVGQEVAKLPEVSTKSMGQVIAAVKQQAGPAADGAAIAQLVKEKLAGAS